MRQVDTDENFYGSEDSVLAAITDGRYTSPSARDLYFLTNGKPTNRHEFASKYRISKTEQDRMAAAFLM